MTSLDQALDQARTNVQNAVREAVSPVVALSFGKDSLLLFALAREVYPEIPALWFKAASTPAQRLFARKLIKEWNTNVYSYEPSDVYLLVAGGNHSMVHEYSINGQTLPLAFDVGPGDTCSLTAFPARTQSLFLPWDVVLVGYKDRDTHWLKGNTMLFRDTGQRPKFAAPIRHLTDEQVRAALCELNIPYEELDDKVSLCTACMTASEDTVWCVDQQRFIPRVQWNSDQALQAFRQRFGLEK